MWEISIFIVGVVIGILLLQTVKNVFYTEKMALMNDAKAELSNLHNKLAIVIDRLEKHV